MQSLRQPVCAAVRWFSIAWVLLLTACSTGPELDRAPARPKDVSSVPDAVPRAEPKSRYGNPESYVVFGKRYYTLDSASGFVERGVASWYGEKFHGRRTSSGEPYDMYAMTAAHKALPLPTYVQVTNLNNGRQVVVRVNDRGPFHDNRVIDMSYAAANRLGMLQAGTALVEVRAIDPAAPQLSKVSSNASQSPRVTNATQPSLYLQVGAFAVKANALKLKQKLHTLSSEGVRISETSSDGQRLYQVQLGPLTTVLEADRLVALLHDADISNPLMVVE